MKTLLLSSTLALGLVALGGSAILAQAGPQGGHNRPSFTELDSNGDGVITLEEVQNQGKAKFAAADSNGDGQLDVAELTAAAAQERAGRIERLIAHKDSNGDGTLSFEEMGARDGGGTRLFAHVDTDGNGEITQAEWDAAIANMPGQGPNGPHGPHGPRGPQTPPASN